MTDHLTNPYGEKGRLYAQTYPGMAAWAGTGPDGKTCRECIHFGKAEYYSVNGKHGGRLKPAPCSKFRDMMGFKGDAVPFDAKACNKFVENALPSSINKGAK